MNTLEFPDHEELMQEAAMWISKIDRGLDNEEELELSSWLELSVANSKALIDHASMWDMLDVLNPISKILPIESLAADFPGDLLTQPLVRKSGIRRHTAAIFPRAVMSVAAAIGIAGIYLWLFNASPLNKTVEPTASTLNEPVPGVRYQSGVGEHMKLTLNDGSKIELNTDTEISVEFIKAKRIVRIVRGEVYFEVAKNPNWPFVAIAGDSHITAVGTAFNIEFNENRATEVIVTEGRVKVDHLGRKESNITHFSQTPVFLSQGQKVMISKDKAEVSSEQNFDQVLAWKDGALVFSGESLDQVVREIDRYTPLSFEIVDKEMASIQVGGVFTTGDLDQLLLVLEQNFGVRSNQVDQRILLYKAD